MAERFLIFGPFRLDLLQSRLWRQAQPIALRPQAFAVLRYLVMHSDLLVTKAELFQHVWDGRQVTDTVLRGCIHAIRVALADTQTLRSIWKPWAGWGIGSGWGGPRRACGRLICAPWWADRGKWSGCGSAGCGPWRGGASLRAQRGGRDRQDHGGRPLCGQPTHDACSGGRAGQCVDTYGDGEPYRPLLEALGQLGQSAHREALLSVLQRYAPTWLVHLPALLGDDERERLQRQLQGATPARMLRELAEALDALTMTLPLVLVLEDLHWSDVATVNVLTYLAQRRDAARLLLLGTYRPADVVVRAHPLRGVLQELRGRGLCDELALELLGPEEVAAYVAARLDGEATAALAARLYHQSEGNALFMVNVLEHLVEQGVVKQEGASGRSGTRIPRRPACRTPCSS